ncbi:MAG: DUF3568 family protein [Phycisphaeraceae bacterium]|nr:DUF3568 family protein [Phycisphaeraceae bacterium]
MPASLKHLAVGLLAASVLTLSGCLAVAAAGGAAGGVAYVMGDLEAVVEATPQKTIKAAELAADDLKLLRIASEASDLEGKLTLRTSSDKKITVTVKKETDAASKLSIRVGIFGDEAMSRALYDKIRAHL